jgi:uncharacterized GH25 family protein
MMRWKLFVSSLLLLIPAVLSAHYVWLEFDGKAEARIFFGEVQEGLREKSPGKLDKIRGVALFAVSGDRTIELKTQKKADHYAAALGKVPDAIVATVKDVAVSDMKKYGGGMAKPFYYARFGARSVTAPVKAALTLDILPVAGSENEFQVVFNGKGVKDIKIMIYAPNTWMQEFKTDNDGKFKVSTPWEGQYVIEALHVEKKNGKFEDKEYEAIRHRTTYTFIKR